MKTLLTKQENRRFRLIEDLTHREDWVTMKEIAKMLDCSTRVLVDDIQYLNEHFDDFTIHTSTKGALITYEPNCGFKMFCQKKLGMSESFMLFEMIFLHPNLTAEELADHLYFSLSKVYRLISRVNLQTKERLGFSIETNPCRIVGNEQNIRYMAYLYFFEKYPHYEWAFKEDTIKKLDEFLERLSQESGLQNDFAYSNVFKVILGVNAIRYRQGHYVTFEGKNEEFLDFLLSTGLSHNIFELLEIDHKDTSIEESTSQLFAQYIKPGFSLSVESFLDRAEEDEVLRAQVVFLKAQLVNLSKKYRLEFENVDEVIYLLFGTAHLEYMEPQSGHILYNRNKYFAEDIAHEFPNFYNDLYRIMKEFRQRIDKPITEDGIYFYMYTVFTWWKNLVVELRRKLDAINVLVISDRHHTHAAMLKDFIDYEFSEQLKVDYYEGVTFEPKDLVHSDYELVVSSFPLYDLKHIRHVYIPNVPKFKDYLKINDQIDAIVLDRISN